jgi:hypothetical protein
VGHAKNQGRELVDSGVRVFVPLGVRIRPIAGIGMP